MPTIAPTAEVHPDAQIADDVTVDAGAEVQAGCVIGSGSHIGRATIIWAGTRIGRGNRIFPFCSIGGEPQDKKYQGETAPLVIGDNNVIREYCFFNHGTAASGETRVGSGNWMMAYVHVAHDCIVGSHTVLANGVQLAGHVQVADYAILGGGVLVHQFRRIGAGCILRGGERVAHDIPPYAMCGRGRVAVNNEGLRRHGVADDERALINRAYRLLYRSNHSLADALTHLRALPQTDAIKNIIAFCQQSNLRLIRPHAQQEDAQDDGD